MKEEKEMRNRNQGITLIVLVITIIILLILAGVTIATLTGDDGILNKTNKASEETDKQTATEIINLKITEAQIASYAEKQQMPSLQFLADSLCEDEEIEYVELTTQKTASVEEAKLKSIAVGEAKSVFTKLKQYPYEFEINVALKLASINGIQVSDNNENQELMTQIQELEKRIEQLENNLKNDGENRTKLLNSPFSISFPTKLGWVDGDFGNIFLQDSIENYKYLIFHYSLAEGAYVQTTVIPVEELNYNNNNIANWNNNSTFKLNLDDGTHYRGVMLWLKNDKTLYVGAVWHSKDQGIIIQNIYGIK